MGRKAYALVTTACANAEDAQPIIDALLSKKLAASVQVIPVTSHYTWKGKVNREEEVLLLIRCGSGSFEAIRDEILSLHKYELPEIIQIPVTDGLAPYLEWIDNPDLTPCVKYDRNR
ncbi:MAG: divalent-cation tolerance protein CutA [Treponema sp.]|nr:divalent-cation tolerance protein CutA [Treponema sp.]